MLEKLPLWGKIFYGVPAAGYFMLGQVILSQIMFFYVDGFRGYALAAPAIVGAIMFFGRIVDAVTDPLVASCSDRLDSPWGRRWPFLIVSAILLPATFVIIFHPPSMEQSTQNAVFLVLMLSLFFTAYTGFANPYLALLPELARTTRDQVDLATIKAAFGLLGTGAGLISAGLLAENLSFGAMAWILGMTAMCLMLFIIPVKEKKYAHCIPSNLGLVESVVKTLKNRPFRFYLAGCLSFWFGGSIVLSAAPFYAHILLDGQVNVAHLYIAAGSVAVPSFFFINFLSKRWGTKMMMLVAMLVLTLALPLYFFIGKPILGIPVLPFAYVVIGLAGFSIAALFIVPDALVASITVHEKNTTGQSREAMFYGTQGLLMKTAMGFSGLLIGVLLQYFGQTVQEPLGVQLTGPVAAVFVLMGFLVFTRYPESEVMQSMKEDDDS